MRDDFEFSRAVLVREESKYHQALGRLFLTWSELEGALYGVLLYYAKVEPEIGRSIFSGARAKLMQEHIDRLGENSTISPARRRDLKFLFSQIGRINTMRDWDCAL